MAFTIAAGSDPEHYERPIAESHCLGAVRRNRWLGIAAALAGFAAAAGSSAVAQDAPAGVRPTIGFKADEVDDALQQRLMLLSERLEAAMAQHHVPGMAIAIVKDDALLFARGFGFADLDEQTLATPHTTFAIGSVTKSFTGALVGTLVDEGRMAWDDALEKHLPYFTLQLRLADDADDEQADAAAQPKATLIDALAHRTGFTRMSPLILHPDIPNEERLRAASKALPWTAYHGGFHYTNIMYLAAGECAVQASGDPDADWHSLVQERLLQPLGMQNAASRAAIIEHDAGLATGYRWRTTREAFETTPWRAPDAVGAAGAIHANVIDMAQWLRMQLNEGEIDGTRIISRESLAMTHQPHNAIAGDIHYGLGWMIEQWHGRNVVQHGGNIDGFSAMCAFVPDEQLGFIWLSNISFTPMQELVRQMVWEALLGELPVADDDEADADARDDEDGDGRYSDLIGDYLANFGPALQDATLKVLEVNGALAVDVPGQMVFELKPPNDEGLWNFAITDAIAIEFDRDEEDRVVALIFHQGGMKLEAPRKGVTRKPEIPLATLQPYLGRYQRDGTTLEVMIQNNRLAIDVPMQMVYELHPPDEDSWRVFRATDQIRARFVESDNGEVTTLIMSQAGNDLEYQRIDEPRQSLPTLSDIAALRKSGARRAALHDAGIIHLTGTINLLTSGITGTIEVWSRGLDQARANTDFSPWLDQQSALNGEIAEERSSVAPYERHEGRMATQARASHPMAFVAPLEDTFDTLTVQRRMEVIDTNGEQRSIIVLQAKRGDLPAWTLHLDEATGDVVRVHQQYVVEGLGALPMQTNYRDFREIEGLRIPFRSDVISEMSGHAVIEIQTVVTQATARESIFKLVPIDVYD